MDRSEPLLTATRLRAGVWEAELRTADGSPTLPRIEVVHLEKPLAGVEVIALDGPPGRWQLRAPVPAAALNDGVQTYLIRNGDSGSTLGSFSVVAGEPLEADLRAEIDLLRAELDMLKKAFRRHCLETGG
ncbi:MAG: hypothetical protein H5U19_08445 [Rhodobacteraceae bacterium]|jgi:hypothetical protein|nr:hypothetical protein [Paracoccaceae bacterium]